MQLSQTAIQTELEKTVVEIYGLANPMFCGQQGAQGIYHEGIGMFSWDASVPLPLHRRGPRLLLTLTPQCLRLPRGPRLSPVEGICVAGPQEQSVPE